MAQTLVQIFIHVVFSTKNRVDMITPEIETELFAYIGGIAANNNSKLVAANGTENHIHLLLRKIAGQISERPLMVDELNMNARYAGRSHAGATYRSIDRQFKLLTRQPEKSTYW